MKLVSALLAAALPGLSALPASHFHSRDVSVSTVYQFPEGEHWFENLVVRPNGMVILTELTAPNLWMIDPFRNSTNEAKNEIQLLYEFPEYLGLLGITEYQPDVFAFIAGNFSIPQGFVSQAGSYGIWSLDLNGRDPEVRKIADVPEAEFLNGMAYLERDDALLLGDAGLGVIWKLNLKTGTSSRVIEDPLMAKVSQDAPDGVNGLKLYGNELWFTRGYDSILAKMHIFDNGTADGFAEAIGSGKNSTWTMDDFVVNNAGQAFVSIPFQNMIARFDAGRDEPVVIAGNINSTEIAEPTSLALARAKTGAIEESVLYIATGGAIADPINGNVTVGGQLIRLSI